ncbi:MAG: alpha/beta hydrolase [Synechococcales bacterium]|nr:alpha/beta hydrolase [Synechococcales bacterium]
MAANTDFVLFAQHGWADTHRDMLLLAQQLAGDTALVVAPNLGYLQTWIQIQPLIQQVEQTAIAILAAHPTLPIRIVGHSMGGLIWLEVLHRHPLWWPRVHSLVLVASPVGGSDLGRLIDPLGLGIAIARDLGTSRRAIAEQIASQIPTLVIAGDIDGGSDGTVPVEATKISHAWFIRLPNLSHPVLKTHPNVVLSILDFWQDYQLGNLLHPEPIIQQLRAVPGMTDGHYRDFPRAKVFLTLNDNRTIRLWKNWMGVQHVFIASPQENCEYAGFVGWLHTQELWDTLTAIKSDQSCGQA